MPFDKRGRTALADETSFASFVVRSSLRSPERRKDALLCGLVVYRIAVAARKSCCASPAFHCATRSRMKSLMLVHEFECDICLYFDQRVLRTHLVNMNKCKWASFARCSFSDIARSHKIVLSACDFSIHARFGKCLIIGVPARNNWLEFGLNLYSFLREGSPGVAVTPVLSRSVCDVGIFGGSWARAVAATRWTSGVVGPMFQEPASVRFRCGSHLVAGLRWALIWQCLTSPRYFSGKRHSSSAFGCGCSPSWRAAVVWREFCGRWLTFCWSCCGFGSVIDRMKLHCSVQGHTVGWCRFHFVMFLLYARYPTLAAWLSWLLPALDGRLSYPITRGSWSLLACISSMSVVSSVRGVSINCFFDDHFIVGCSRRKQSFCRLLSM